MRKIILILCLIICVSQSFAQGPPRNNQYWYWGVRSKWDSAAGIPRKYGLTLNTSDTTPQIFVKDSTLYYYSAGHYYAARGGNVIDTTSLSNRIEQRLYITDTVNAFGNRFLESITSGMVTTALGYFPVPQTRTLSINGQVYDLTANRSWSIPASAPYSVIPGTYSYTMPSGQLLEKIEIIEPTSVSIDIGTTVGAHDIAEDIPVTTGYANFGFDYYAQSGQTIYFTGATINTIFKIYFR